MELEEIDFKNIAEYDLAKFAEFDECGFILSPGENLENFISRVEKFRKSLLSFFEKLEKKGEVELGHGLNLKESNRIPFKILEEAGDITYDNFGFRIDWVPAFFPEKNLGFLWGGCAVNLPEKRLLIFIIRSDFRKRRKWFIYRRDEILAHELCHIARNPLNDMIFEEYFAYSVSKSSVRRYMGNCFRAGYDAVLFLLPVLLLLSVQLINTFMEFNFPVWIFWISAFVYPVFLLIRNQIARNLYFRALKKLKNLQIFENNEKKVLFRTDYSEIKKIAGSENREELRQTIENFDDLRWKVIKFRFANNYNQSK